jgi:hypothetical protein
MPNHSSQFEAHSFFFPKLWAAARKHPAHSGMALLLVVLLVASAVLRVARPEHLIVVMVLVLCGWLVLGHSGEVPLLRGVALIALLAAAAFVLWSMLVRPRILLSGTIQDDKGQLIVRATVMLRDTSCSVWTDAVGQFAFESVGCPDADSLSQPRVDVHPQGAGANCAALPLKQRRGARIVLPRSCLITVNDKDTDSDNDIVLDGRFTASATKVDHVVLAGTECASAVNDLRYFAFRRGGCLGMRAIADALEKGAYPLLSVQVGDRECSVQLTKSLQNVLDVPADCLTPPPPRVVECRKLEVLVKQRMQPKANQRRQDVLARVDRQTHTVTFKNRRSLSVPDDLFPKSPARCRDFYVPTAEM